MNIMSKFFDYGDEDISAEGWYRITATNVNMNKPDGLEVSFWLYGKSEHHIRQLLDQKGWVKIKSMERKEMDFDDLG